MAKLTDTQLIVLSKAAAQENGIAPAPEKMSKSAAVKVGSSLIARKLMREVKSKPGMPVWREDTDGRQISLVITRAGRDAIGIQAAEGDPSAATASEAGEFQIADRRVGKRDCSTDAAPSPAERSIIAGPRAGSKQALVIKMLSAESGTTLDALVDATGWLPHTTRAALTGLRKRGFAVVRETWRANHPVIGLQSLPPISQQQPDHGDQF